MAIDIDPRIDLYKALGVAPSASADEIKKAYRALAKKYHPDSTGGDKAKEARFKEVSQAYEVLGDDAKRKKYDAMRANPGFGRAGMGGPGGPGGMPGMDGAFDLSDLFGQFFGGAQGGRGGRVHVETNYGGPRQRMPSEPPPAPQVVKASDGTTLTVDGNDVHSDVRLPFDRAMMGTVATVATLTAKAELKIPAGTSSGKKLRLRGKGLTDRAGRTGDHYVTVQIDVPAVKDEELTRQLVAFANRVRKAGQND